MERSFISPDGCSINNCELPRPLRSDRSRYKAAFALTMEAFWILVLLASLGVWAVVWAAAASLASAFLQ